MPGYLGKADCHLCGNEVDVSENRANRAYYRCARCGFWAQLVNPRGDRMLRAQVRGEADPDAETPEPATEPKAPAAPEPSTIPTPHPAPSTAQKPAKRAAGFFFSGAK